MYDQVASAEIVLRNKGKVGFEFSAIGIDPAMMARPKPGMPLLLPHTVSHRTNGVRGHASSSSVSVGAPIRAKYAVIIKDVQGLRTTYLDHFLQ